MVEASPALSRNNPKRIRNPKTPWQRAFAHIGLSVHSLAKEMDTSPSTISRALRAQDGYISGKHQKKLLDIGKKIGRELDPHLLVPND